MFCNLFFKVLAIIWRRSSKVLGQITAAIVIFLLKLKMLMNSRREQRYGSCGLRLYLAFLKLLTVPLFRQHLLHVKKRDHKSCCCLNRNLLSLTKRQDWVFSKIPIQSAERRVTRNSGAEIFKETLAIILAKI